MKLRSLVNGVLLPLRLALPHEVTEKIGLQSMRGERCATVIAHSRGRLLDIGCGSNTLVKTYGHDSVGVDVYDFGGDALIVEDTSSLPFGDGSFETVSFVASLNHIPNRAAVLREARRVLCDDGRLLVTMLSPVIGKIRHRMALWDTDQHERGMQEDELMGMAHRHVVELVESQGFRFDRRIRFVLGMNSLYIFSK